MKTFKTRHPLYNTWRCMVARCTNSTNPAFKYYGARGITICADWLNSFEIFVEDMGERPIGTSLDRIDTNGNYSKDNCRWATQKEQMNNTRIQVARGYSVALLTANTEIPASVARRRLKRGSSLEDALTDSYGNHTNKAMCNSTSNIRGLYYHKTSKTWQGQLSHAKKKYFAGTFKDKKEAFIALNNLRKSLGLKELNYE